MTDFSDYVVFVDESGDHSLTSIDPGFPVFALSFCVISKADYINAVVPAVQALKFKYWGHDAVILHEHEIRKRKGDFTLLLTNPDLRAEFLADLHQIMVDSPFKVIGSVIDKVKLKSKYADPWNPYEIALHFCLEKLLVFLRSKGQDGRHVHVLFECRGKEEDAALELAFLRIVDGTSTWGYRKHDFRIMRFDAKFIKKSTNSIGLQLADLTARPIALQTMRPDQPNRTYDVIRAKSVGIKVFP